MKSPKRLTPFKLTLLPAIALGASAFFLALTANAGPMEKNPVVENLQRPFNWTGFYIGGNIGGQQSELELTGSGHDTDGHLFSDVDLGSQFPFAGEAGTEFIFFRFIDQPLKNRPDREEFHGSILGGGQIGYQHQFGHFVLGIEGDFDRTAARITRAFRDFTPDPVIIFEDLDTITADSEFVGRRTATENWQGSVRAKVGYATGPVLFYATGGVTFAQVDLWAHDMSNTLFEEDAAPPVPVPPLLNAPTQFPGEAFHVVNTEVDKDDDVMVGWTAGAGLEVAFNDAVSVALEYRHNGYGDQTFHFGGSHAQSHGTIFPGDTNLNFDSDQVTIRMNLLLCHMFGHGGMASASPATNNVAIKSPFGSNAETVQVGYTKAKDADTWSAKDKEVKVEEPFNWTGFYVGANVGGVWSNYDFSGYGTDVDVGEIFLTTREFRPADAPDAPAGQLLSVRTPFQAPALDGGSDDSLIGGGQVGYQHQFGHFVVGVEADFSGLSSTKSTQFATNSATLIDDTAFAFSNLYTERKATTDWIGTARLKLGYAVGPVMFYVTGGGAWANVRTWATDLDVTDFVIPRGDDGAPSAPSGIPAFNVSGRSTNTTNDEDTVFGWTAGGGGEWAFSKIASLAVEYRHNEFDSADAHYDPHHSAIFGSGYHVDMDSDQVTVKVNLLLGHMGPGH